MFGSRFSRVGFVFVALLAVPALSWAQLPSKDLTPGKTLKVTKEQVCSAGFVSPAKPLKDNDAADALSGYGQRPDSGRELIHLVPLSLGGTNDKENLWPLPNSREFGPAQKKALDEALQKKVCDGSVDLKDAQDALKKNWMEAYKKYVTQ